MSGSMEKSSYNNSKWANQTAGASWPPEICCEQNGTLKFWKQRLFLLFLTEYLFNHKLALHIGANSWFLEMPFPPRKLTESSDEVLKSCESTCICLTQKFQMATQFLGYLSSFFVGESLQLGLCCYRCFHSVQILDPTKRLDTSQRRTR